MAKMGDGYGSECHLLRWMGRHREAFDNAVKKAANLTGDLSWADFPFEPKNRWADREWKGLEFLGGNKKYASAVKDWKKWWPQGKGIHNWDAVGELSNSNEHELILVEAKGNLQEIAQPCKAKEHGGRPRINQSLKETADAIGVPYGSGWLMKDYQYANRLAVLHFLNSRSIPARLLFVYFVGDKGSKKRTCPQTITGWKSPLHEQKKRLGIQNEHNLSKQVHELFLHVSKQEAWSGPAKTKSIQF